MNITRNRQSVSFATGGDADIVQTSPFLNSAGLPIPLHDYLIGGVHVVASTGPLARQAIREHKAQTDAAAEATATDLDETLGELLSAVDDVLQNALDQGYYHDNLRAAIDDYRKVRRVTPDPAGDTYIPPATWHPGRCFCGRFGGGHIPGLRAPIRGDKPCEGDRVAPHDASSCGVCLAGATDGPPPATARRAETGYGSYAVLSAQYHRNGSSGLGFFVGLVRGLDGEGSGRTLQVVTLLSRDSEATEYDGVPVFVTDPTDPTSADHKFRGDNFTDVAWAIVDTVNDQWDAHMAELATRNANR